MDEEQIATVCKQCLKALAYLHSQGTQMHSMYNYLVQFQIHDVDNFNN